MTAPTIPGLDADLAVTSQSRIAELRAEALRHPGVRHPYLRRLADGAFTDMDAALRQLAVEYSGHVLWMPHHLRQAARQVQDARHVAIVRRAFQRDQGALDERDNRLLRELGIAPQTVRGAARSQLFQHFGQALGVQDWEVAECTHAAWQWGKDLETLLDGASAAEAIGAIALGEAGVERAMHRQVLQGLLALGSLRRSALVYFELSEVDTAHHDELLTIAEQLAATPAGLAGLRRGMLAALQLRAAFWDHLHRSATSSQLAHPA